MGGSGSQVRGATVTYLGRIGRGLRSPVVQFGLSGLLAVVIVAVVAAVLFDHEATSEALRDAENTTQVTGNGVIAPALTPAFLAGRPAALRRMNAIVHRRVLLAPVVRVKIWRGDGTILYSDESRLIGERYHLGDEEQTARRGRSIDAEVSDLQRPENRFERGFHSLREVYMGITPAGAGAPVLFEEYLRDSSIARTRSRIFNEFAPVFVGAFVLLAIVQLPLASSLGRRLRRGQRDREKLLRQAITASETERRRIARDLHDGVVQDLAAVSYTLSTAGAELDPRATRARAAIDDAGAHVRQSIRQLRSLLVELYPPSLHRQGLHRALLDLLAAFEPDGVETSLRFDDAVDLDEGREALVYRAVQEALRNVAAHANASEVRVSVTAARSSDAVLVVVADNGDGFDLVDDDRPRFGLRMLEDLASHSGGRLELDSRTGHGTTVRLTVPRCA
jgi:two-component system, NarL family, sensor kinase